MAAPELVESTDRLEVRSPTRRGMRIVFAILGIFPLLAPYELLIRVGWQHYLNAFFFLAALISTGAIALSGVLFFAAVASLSSRMVFDKRRSTFVFSSEAPLIRRGTHSYPLSAVQNADVEVREWSDGAPTYILRVSMTDGTVFESGAAWSRDELETICTRVQQFLGEADSSQSAFQPRAST
jgi:hypothetical protein